MSAAAAPEVTRFLREYPPFDALEAGEVERVAAAAEVEFHRAGTTIFSQGAEPVEHLRVVRSGAVEIVFDGRVLDLLGEGELFGQASMLSGIADRLRGPGRRGHGLLPDRGRGRAGAAVAAGGTAVRRAVAARARDEAAAPPPPSPATTRRSSRSAR